MVFRVKAAAVAGTCGGETAVLAPVPAPSAVDRWRMRLRAASRISAVVRPEMVLRRGEEDVGDKGGDVRKEEPAVTAVVVACCFGVPGEAGTPAELVELYAPGVRLGVSWWEGGERKERSSASALSTAADFGDRKLVAERVRVASRWEEGEEGEDGTAGAFVAEAVEDERGG